MVTRSGNTYSPQGDLRINSPRVTLNRPGTSRRCLRHPCLVLSFCLEPVLGVSPLDLSALKIDAVGSPANFFLTDLFEYGAKINGWSCHAALYKIGGPDGYCTLASSRNSCMLIAVTTTYLPTAALCLSYRPILKSCFNYCAEIKRKLALRVGIEPTAYALTVRPGLPTAGT